MPDDKVKDVAPLPNPLLDTMYSHFTILPLLNDLPNIPSPKYISNSPVSVSCKK